MKKIVIVQRRLTDYRVPFFQLLKIKLKERRIELQLLVGTGTKEEGKKCDSGVIDWATIIPTSYFLENRFCWQPVRKYLSDTDMVVVTQENALISNHLLMLPPRKTKVAFWGHGANLQSNSRNGIKERFKRWTTRHADWYFAYTRLSADLVTSSGFPGNRLTILNNAMDTSELRQHKKNITKEAMMALRNAMDFGEGPIGVFIGSFYRQKRLDFLFKAADAIRLEIPGFQLMLIGDGPEQEKVKTWCKQHSWVHWAGRRLGYEKVACLQMAQIMLNPGGVGLGILDALVCEVPMLTTNNGKHGPEIAYLENGHNGVITENELGEYVRAAIHLLRNPATLKILQEGCAKSAEKYTLDNMVNRFVDGVEKAIIN